MMRILFVFALLTTVLLLTGIAGIASPRCVQYEQVGQGHIWRCTNERGTLTFYHEDHPGNSWYGSQFYSKHNH